MAGADEANASREASMYQAVRQRPGNSSKAAGASIAVLVTALVGYALSSGLAMKIVETLSTQTTVVVVAKKELPADPTPREDLDTSIDLDRPDPMLLELPVFTLGESPMIAGNLNPGTGRGDGSSGTGGGGKKEPVRTRAKLISGNEPVYPPASVRADETGVTGLSVCLSEKGRVTSAALASSSGFQRLDDATLTWVKRARFSPATADGKPEAVCGHRIEYEWKLQKFCIDDYTNELKPCPRKAR
jgi:protein TonB